MKQFRTLIALAAVSVTPLLPQTSGNPFVGRWDVTVTRGNLTFPGWMEVVERNGTPAVRVQLRTGSVRPTADAKIDGSRMRVLVSAATPAEPAEGDLPAIPARPEMVWELTAAGGKLTGTQKQGRAVFQLAAVRAPALKRAAPQAWNDPVPLFNGKDLTGWQPINNTANDPSAAFKSHWVAKNGELVNEGRGANIRTTQTFEDFKLHVEYLCPPGENSGIYLRGRYEAQVSPPPGPGPGRTPAPARRRAPVYRNQYGGVGGIYGYLGPSTPPPFAPEWQSYDITLIGRWVTIVFNGVTTVDNQEIPGITGGALDSNEGEPGPIYFQGDHHGGIRYRNITISTAKR